MLEFHYLEYFQHTIISAFGGNILSENLMDIVAYIIKRRRNKLKNKFSLHKNFSNKSLNSNYFFKIITVHLKPFRCATLSLLSVVHIHLKNRKASLNMSLKAIAEPYRALNDVSQYKYH